MAERAIDLGYYISMSGIVSFPKATNVHEVCQKIPDDRLLIETDAPWLAPVPYRGKTNEPAFVSYVAEAVAKLRGTTPEAIAEQTTENFYRLFLAAQS
jgi:TatD DNase family protein